MHDSTGIALIVAGAAVAIVTALVLRTRAPAAIVAVVLALCGAAFAVGGLLVLDHASPTEWVLTVAVLVVLVPAHARVVLGPLGRRADGP